MKKIVWVLMFVIGLLSQNGFADLKKVLICKVTDHMALNLTVQGIIDALKEKGYEAGKTLDLRVESAQGNAALSGQIANKFLSQNPDVVVGVATVAAQSFLRFKGAGRAPLVFSSVTDPVTANLAKTPQKGLKNITGVSNFVDLEPQIDLFLKLQPSLKRLGILYNPGESNSVAIIEKLEVLAAKRGIKVIKQTASKTAEIPQAAVKLAQEADAIFISNDNTALSALQSVIKAARGRGIPVYVSDTDAVELGAVAALGPNQYEVGKQTGGLIAQILDGEPVDSLEISYPRQKNLYLNLDAARSAGIIIPQDVLRQASKVIGSPQ